MDGLGPYRPFLGAVLPELGPAPSSVDRATLVETLCRAIAGVGGPGPATVVLDDLHRVDDATLELLPALAPSLATSPVVLVGISRTDEPERSPVLRAVRTALRRERRVTELALGPLSGHDVELLIEQRLGAAPTPRFAALVEEATQGVPFLIEELAASVSEDGRLSVTPQGLAIAEGASMSVPSAVRDAVALRTDGLSAAGRAALEAAAASGAAADAELVAQVADEAGLEEAVHAGLLVLVGDGGVAFRSGLTREAVSDATPASRRRALHRRLAGCLRDRGGPHSSIAEHWVAAGNVAEARAALVRAAHEACEVHAYRDAARAARRALDLWPADEDGEGRLALVERLADCAELSGDLTAAALAWREIAAARRARDEGARAAAAQARLAAVAARRGESRQAVAAALAAAAGFAIVGDHGAAARERLLAAAFLQSAGDLRLAMAAIRQAAGEARRAGREDLAVRGLVLEGIVRAKLGAHAEGLAAVEEALSRALAAGLGEAAEAYAAIPRVIENSADYRTTVAAYETAAVYCDGHGAAASAAVCRSCMAHILRITGRWRRAADICQAVLSESEDESHARCVAGIVLGSIHACRGELRPARRLLSEWEAVARRLRSLGPEIELDWYLARLSLIEGDGESAADRCRAVLERWAQSDDHHYAVHALRWSSTVLAQRGDQRAARACTEALGRMAADTGNAEVLSALAHAVGETALLDGEPERAASQFLSSLELSRAVAIPHDRAETQMRAAGALAAVGRAAEAADLLRQARRTALRLGARPLASEAARALAGLGGADAGIEVPIGSGALDGLSPRELQVLRLLTDGATNRAIAGELVLSVRTVDMHVRHVLSKLDCRSRTEAAARGVVLLGGAAPEPPAGRSAD
jgi:DNA-binding NarL/FixJ family response regulator